MRRGFALLMLSIVMGCAHQLPAVSPSGLVPISDAEYTQIIRRNTYRTNQYSGLYQTFQAGMTILTSEVQNTILQQRAYYLMWDKTQLQNERTKMLDESAAYSKFFLSFYSPDHDYDDLHKGKSMWRVYLEFNGQRYEGKVKKLDSKLVDLQATYPYLDRFSTPYDITFNVPMSTVQGGPCKVLLTSSLGAAEFSFPVKP